MPDRRCSWSRHRLLGLVCVAAVFGLTMLHPYPRQSLFGPKLRGVPWCVWEDAARRQFGEQPESRLQQLQRWLGVPQTTMTLDDLDDPEMLPLVLVLLEDPDELVRDAALLAIIAFPNLRDDSVVPVLRRMRDDPKQGVAHRLTAAQAIYVIAPDAEAMQWIVRHLENPDAEVRGQAMMRLARIAAYGSVLISRCTPCRWSLSCLRFNGRMYSSSSS
jgi:hypothetical protein